MAELEIKGTTTTPMVKSSGNHLLIYGRSVPEDANKFYTPIFEWIQSNMDEYPTLELEFALDYLNSITFKIFFDLITRITRNDTDVKVVWTYEEDDDSILTEGEILSKKSGIDFEFNPIEELE